MDRPGIFWEEPSSCAVTYESEVIHPVVSVSHRAIDGTRVSSVQSEICPERSAEKSHSANQDNPQAFERAVLAFLAGG